MRILRATLKTCGNATGLVVAIDVLRAFTTSAYAFAAGADQITLVSTIEEAFSLREQKPGLLLMGEVEGQPIDGFDFGNSPSALIDLDLNGQHLVHRSTAGTQGVTRSINANTILASSLCCISATVRYVKKKSPATVTLIETGVFSGGWGDEDVACADMIENLLLDEPYDLNSIIRRVQMSRSGSHYLDPTSSVFPPKDIKCAIAIDHFDFAMVVSRRNGQMVMKTVP